MVDTILSQTGITLPNFQGYADVRTLLTDFTILNTLFNSMTRNVYAHGAVGDGVADDTAAIAAAIAACPTGGIVFFPQGRYKVTTLAITKPLTLQGVGSSTYNSDVFGSSTWASRVWEAGSVIECAATSGSVISYLTTHVEPLHLRDLCIKGLGANTRTTVGISLGSGSFPTARCVWSNVTFLNLKTGLLYVGGNDSIFTNTVVGGCDVGVNLGTNANQNVFAQFNAAACNTGMLIANNAMNSVFGGAIQGCATWGMDVTAEETLVEGVYFENTAATGGAFICRTPGGDSNLFRNVHLGTANDDVSILSNGNLIETAKTAAGTITFGVGSLRNRLISDTATLVDSGTGNYYLKVASGPSYIFGSNGGPTWSGPAILTAQFTTLAAQGFAVQVRDDLVESRLLDTVNNFGYVRMVPNAAGGRLGFYNVTPVARQLLATGAAHTVDDVITALQTLGLLRQS